LIFWRRNVLQIAAYGAFSMIFPLKWRQVGTFKKMQKMQNFLHPEKATKTPKKRNIFAFFTTLKINFPFLDFIYIFDMKKISFF